MRKILISGIILLVLSSSFPVFAISTTNPPISLEPLQGNVRKISSFDLVEVVDQQEARLSYYGLSFFHENWIAQSFIPRLSSLTRIEVYLFKTGTPSPNIMLTMHIRTQDDGVDLASCTIPGSFVPDGNGGWVNFGFTNIQLTVEQTYYIVLEASDGASNNTYAWMTGEGDYQRGATYWSDNGGSSWHQNSMFPDSCFKTYGLEQPPTTPTIAGPTQAKVRVPTEYCLTASDPDGTSVQYLIDWGDGQTTTWTNGNVSNDSLRIQHTYEKQGSYTIKAKARDVFLAESDWGSLPITIPLNYTPSPYPLLTWLLDHVSNIIQFLHHLNT